MLRVTGCEKIDMDNLQLFFSSCSFVNFVVPDFGLKI